MSVDKGPEAPGRTHTVLVTGTTGFIGRVVAAKLARAGHQVRRSGLTRGGEDVLRLPLAPATDFTEALHRCETVVHLAGRAHVLNKRDENPLEAFRAVNSVGTRALAEAAARAGVRHFVYLSSVAVLGPSRGRAFTDRDDPAPVTPYAISKLEGEQALDDVAGHSGMSVTILRPPMVYGPGAVGHFGRLQHLVARGVPLPLGAVDNARSVIGVANLAYAISTVVAQAEAARGTFLCSDGHDVSSPELVRAIARALGQKARLFSVPPLVLQAGALLLGRSADYQRLTGSLTLDSSRFCGRLNWQAPLSLEQGLADATE